MSDYQSSYNQDTGYNWIVAPPCFSSRSSLSIATPHFLSNTEPSMKPLVTPDLAITDCVVSSDSSIFRQGGEITSEFQSDHLSRIKAGGEQLAISSFMSSTSSHFSTYSLYLEPMSIN
jgi:hypothetical protein